MAQADLVVIAAPDWDMTFPRGVEDLSGVDLYPGDHLPLYPNGGCRRGCAGRRSWSISPPQAAPWRGKNFGFDYVRELGQMLGHPCRPLSVCRGAGHPGK